MAVTVTEHAKLLDESYKFIEFDGSNAADIVAWCANNNVFQYGDKIREDSGDLYLTTWQLVAGNSDVDGFAGATKTTEVQVAPGDRLLMRQRLGAGEHDVIGVLNEAALGDFPELA